MDKATIQSRLTYWREQLGNLMDTYTKLISGGVKSYQIDDRSLTRFDIPSLRKAIDDAEERVAEYEALLEDQGTRKAYAVVPRDY